MKKPDVSEAFLKTISDQARFEYPKECCGLVLGPCGQNKYTRVYPCRNLQDEYHAKDPVLFPRTSRTAYWIDPAELVKLQKELRKTEEEIKIIYHSHIDTGAYFSQEDQRMALQQGTPLYPGVIYLVISVTKGFAREVCFYDWNSEEKSYQKIAVP